MIEFKISKESRDSIVQVILNSELPMKLGVQIVNILNSLDEIKNEKNNKVKLENAQ